MTRDRVQTDMAQEDCGGVAAPMGYSRQRSVDPSHYPMCSGVDGEETWTHDLSSHPGINGAWLLSQLPQECTKARSAQHVLKLMRTWGTFCSYAPGFGKREKVLGSYGKPLTPEGIGRCLLSSQRGWDAVIGLATEVVDRLNSIRRDEERSGSRPIEDQAV